MKSNHPIKKKFEYKPGTMETLFEQHEQCSFTIFSNLQIGMPSPSQHYFGNYEPGGILTPPPSVLTTIKADNKSIIYIIYAHKKLCKVKDLCKGCPKFKGNKSCPYRIMFLI